MFQVTATTQHKQQEDVIVGLVQWLEYWVVTPVMGFESPAHPKFNGVDMSLANELKVIAEKVITDRIAAAKSSDAYAVFINQIKALAADGVMQKRVELHTQKDRAAMIEAFKSDGFKVEQNNAYLYTIRW